jgi:hypothetical protein
MDTYEGSMPFRFTPDGLDESAIDALIEEADAQFADVPPNGPIAIPAPLPVRRRKGKRPSRGQAA